MHSSRPASVSVTQASQSDAQRWDEYVNRAEHAALYHLSGWRDVISETFGHRTVYLYAQDHSGILGVLPLAQLKSRVFGNLVVSLPFFNYGGICADSPDVREALLRGAIDVAQACNAKALEIRHERDWFEQLPKRTTKVAMRLPLPESGEELWKRLGSKLRNQVNRPRKEGMIATVGGEEELDAFYDVFASNMRDLGTPVYARDFFRNILRRFPDRAWICTVRLQGTPVAAGFLAGFKDRLEIPWASAVRAHNRLSPNMLLYWRCLEFACERGFRVFDFGRSTAGEGTYKFKEQWGAKPQPLFWHYWMRDGNEIPQVNPDNPKYRMAIAAWRRLPLSVTTRLGPGIVKYIP